MNVLKKAVGWLKPKQQVQVLFATLFISVAVVGQTHAETNDIKSAKIDSIKGCIQSGNKCTCYDGEAIELEEISTAMCKDYIKGLKGLPFDSLRDNAPVNHFTRSETVQN